MDFAKFMSRTWKLFVEQEDIGPWEHLWRRANFFFDTDEKFRLETVILSGLIIVMAFLLISLSWICSRRYRKKVHNACHDGYFSIILIWSLHCFRTISIFKKMRKLLVMWKTTENISKKSQICSR